MWRIRVKAIAVNPSHCLSTDGHSAMRCLSISSFSCTKKGYRCIGIELRGFGESHKPWGEYNYEIFADDIEHVLCSLALNSVTLAGFLMGGAIAMRHASKYLSPNRFSQLILMGAAAPSFTKRNDSPYGLEKSDCDNLIAESLNDGPKMVSDFSKIFFRNEESQSKAMRDWLFAINMQASAQATMRCLEELRDLDLRNEMKNIKT